MRRPSGRIAICVNEVQTMNEITLLSFGSLYGMPTEADTVIGTRGLPNPYYVRELKSKTGLEQAVRDYVFSTPEAEAYYESAHEHIEGPADPARGVEADGAAGHHGCQQRYRQSGHDREPLLATDDGIPLGIGGGLRGPLPRLRTPHGGAAEGACFGPFPEPDAAFHAVHIYHVPFSAVFFTRWSRWTRAPPAPPAGRRTAAPAPCCGCCGSC